MWIWLKKLLKFLFTYYLSGLIIWIVLNNLFIKPPLFSPEFFCKFSLTKSTTLCLGGILKPEETKILFFVTIIASLYTFLPPFFFAYLFSRFLSRKK